MKCYVMLSPIQTLTELTGKRFYKIDNINGLKQN